MVLFQHGASDVTYSSWFHSGEFEGDILLNKPGTVQLVLHDAQMLRNGEWSWLKQHNFATFRHILTKLGGKVYIFVLNSCPKFHTKIYIHCWYINKSYSGKYFFTFTLYMSTLCSMFGIK